MIDACLIKKNQKLNFQYFYEYISFPSIRKLVYKMFPWTIDTTQAVFDIILSNGLNSRCFHWNHLRRLN